ncbi:heavy metal-associated isoprenylated plant protein 2-like [Papaver somniferum]|uniref:heavy metal-associated isoprenylated plant protein 2-like n=1 Tax=Papaver somniferum TaxID=3469 RepID=UPI000E705C89|nr:heavy metal-associated isoprenylated plant protein 2-like [Papaver somniferum]
MSKVQKSVVSVDLLCSKCKKKVMKLVAGVEGINSIALDSTKSTVTVVGPADPVDIIKKVRKFKKTAEFVSIGPFKPEEKKDDLKKDVCPYLPKTCQRCDVWYVVGEEWHHPCSIL